MDDCLYSGKQKNQQLAPDFPTEMFAQQTFVLCLTQTMRLLTANDYFFAELGYTRGALINQPFALLDLEYHTEKELFTFWHAIQMKEPWQGELAWQTVTGTVIWVRAFVTVVDNHLDEPCLWVQAFDISLYKARELKLLEMTEKAEQANSHKNMFLTNMSHELRTPLHAILSFAHLGIEETRRLRAGDKFLHYFGRITESGDRLLDLINNLLDLSRMQAQPVQLHYEMTNLRELVVQAADELEQLAKKNNIMLLIEEDLIGSVLECDPERIYQVLINLLWNAIKFAPQGSMVAASFGRSRLNLHSHSLDGFSEAEAVILRIRDQGQGIPPDELEEIFKPFVQSSQTVSGSGGSGLGLAICSEIITAHGGRIWAENPDEGGAIFSVLLPVKKVS